MPVSTSTSGAGRPDSRPSEQVMLATDGGPAGEAALRWLADRGTRRPLTVEIVDVVEPGDELGEEPGATQRTARQAAERAKALLERLAPGIAVGATVLAGEPIRTIRHAARACDLLVVGTNRAAGRGPHLAPSFATRLAAGAFCPTVVVRRGWEASPGPVVVGVAGDGSEDDALPFAAREAALLGRELVLVHAGHHAPGPESSAAGGPEAFAAEDELRAVAARLRLDAPGPADRADAHRRPARPRPRARRPRRRPGGGGLPRPRRGRSGADAVGEPGGARTARLPGRGGAAGRLSRVGRTALPAPGPVRDAATGGLAHPEREEIDVTSTTGIGAVEPQQSARVERVVLAADDSFGAIAAAGWLAARARHHRMTIEIAVVQGHVRTGPRSGSAHQAGEGVAWGMREYLAARIPAALTTVRVLPGEPVEALRTASVDGDLFVIGCNREGYWHRLPIATRSTRIAEVAVRPTVVVPSTWVPGPGVVLAAASGVAPEVVDWAAEEAAASGRVLEILHGDLLATRASSLRLPDIGILEEAERRMIASHLARVRAVHPGLQVGSVLEHEGVARGLVARGGDSATIVVGTRTHHGAGSVLRAVLERTSCPVVVVPVAGDEDGVAR